MKTYKPAVEYLEIGLASPDTIRQWGKKNLPNGKVFGEVTSPQTVNYKTLKPVKKGLFCERIFGPVEDFVCSCGKKPEQNQRFCNECDVEYTVSKVRRYRLGYIELGNPVAHVWFFKGRINYIATLLGIRRRKVDAFLYGTRITHSFDSLNFLFTLVNKISPKKFLFSRDYNFIFILPVTFPSSWHSEQDGKRFVDFFTKLPKFRDFPLLEYFPQHFKTKNLNRKKRLALVNLSGLVNKVDSTQGFSYKSLGEGKTSFNQLAKLTQKEKAFSVPETRVPASETGFFEKETIKKSFQKFLLKTAKVDFDEINTTLVGYFCEFFQNPDNVLKKLPKVNNISQNETYFKRKKNQKTFNFKGSLLKKLVLGTEIKDSQNQIMSTKTNQLSSELKSESYLSEARNNPRTKLDAIRSTTSVTIQRQKLKDPAFMQTLPYTKEQSVSSQLPCIGAQPFREALANLDLTMLDFILSKKLEKLNGELAIWLNKHLPIPVDPEIESYTKLKRRRLVLLQRIKLIKNFIRTKQKPEWIVLLVLPVLPPGLRPILQLSGDQVAISDLNILYQKILGRNRRFSQKPLTNPLYTQCLLQQSVDALIANGKSGAEPACASNGRPLKSLSDMLKGKTGRFRQNLLGKRVDYSGRSVIVVGPQLQIHECGLPKEMALELFQPFLIRKLQGQGLVRSLRDAKNFIDQQSFVIWNLLEQILEDHLVLLNRAPTLHRLGIQAFKPKLVNGRAILLHPLVCTGFNADFDGDQMAVHIPLSYQARAEAWQLMWSRNNILSPATGQPILSPSQDMVLGCYYLTTENSRKQNLGTFFFSDFKEALLAYSKNILDIHAFIWIRCQKGSETGNKSNFPFEIRIDSFGNSLELYDNTQYFLDFTGNVIHQHMRTTIGRVIFNEIIQECF